MFQPLDHFHGPPVDMFQQVHVSPILRIPHLDAVLQVSSHQRRTEGHLSHFAGHSFFLYSLGYGAASKSLSLVYKMVTELLIIEWSQDQFQRNPTLTASS